MELRLLIETNDPVSQPSLSLESKNWTLSKPIDLGKPTQLPSFACISYRWGSEREPHALDENLVMSTHTCPSLAAAIRIGKSKAFWTDVFCVPHDGPERQSTLENMGYIYSCASEVIIVLSETSFHVIEVMIRHGLVSESDLQTLECDEWVASVWTYQEIVNGGSVHFVSERHSSVSASIECSDFFNALGNSLSTWKRSTGCDAFATTRIFPNLDVLENTLADWQTSAYTLRSALSVFSNIASKRNANPANYFYAILGALTSSPQQLTWHTDQTLAEKVMTICEQKNDFSFIYTAAPRDLDPQKRWRPRAMPLPQDSTTVPVVLRPVLAWHCWGEAQHGHYDAAGFWLHGMTTMQPTSHIGHAGKKSISGWLSQPELQSADDITLQTAVFTTIDSIGFDGHADPIVVTEGLIFSQEPITNDKIEKILVSNQIRWTMGAPGLVHIYDGHGKEYVPCVFIGSSSKLLDGGESVLL